MSRRGCCALNAQMKRRVSSTFVSSSSMYSTLAFSTSASISDTARWPGGNDVMVMKMMSIMMMAIKTNEKGVGAGKGDDPLQPTAP